MSARFVVRYAAQICRTGGVIAYPTESVYGLGCDPLNAASVSRILELKQRHVDKGVILISDDLQKILPFINVDRHQQQQMLQPQEKPTTWLVMASDLTPHWIRGSHEKVAVRVTRHKVAAELCSYLPWPIVSTSANPAKKQPARSAMCVRHYFAAQLDAIISASVNVRGNPSVIRDLETGKILRA